MISTQRPASVIARRLAAQVHIEAVAMIWLLAGLICDCSTCRTGGGIFSAVHRRARLNSQLHKKVKDVDWPQIQGRPAHGHVDKPLLRYRFLLMKGLNLVPTQRRRIRLLLLRKPLQSACCDIFSTAIVLTTTMSLRQLCLSDHASPSSALQPLLSCPQMATFCLVLFSAIFLESTLQNATTEYGSSLTACEVLAGAILSAPSLAVDSF